MSPGARMEYLASIYKRYKEATKKGKSIILDEFCSNCQYHRKHAIRLLKHYKRYSLLQSRHALRKQSAR